MPLDEPSPWTIIDMRRGEDGGQRCPPRASTLALSMNRALLQGCEKRGCSPVMVYCGPPCSSALRTSPQALAGWEWDAPIHWSIVGHSCLARRWLLLISPRLQLVLVMPRPRTLFRRRAAATLSCLSRSSTPPRPAWTLWVPGHTALPRGSSQLVGSKPLAVPQKGESLVLPHHTRIARSIW